MSFNGHSCHAAVHCLFNIMDCQHLTICVTLLCNMGVCYRSVCDMSCVIKPLAVSSVQPLKLNTNLPKGTRKCMISCDIVLYVIVWYSLVSYCIVWYCMVSYNRYGTVLHGMYGIVSHGIVPYCIASYCMVSYHMVL